MPSAQPERLELFKDDPTTIQPPKEIQSRTAASSQQEDEWVLVDAPSTGAHFYWNKWTGEMKTEMPTAQRPQDRFRNIALLKEK
jgi:hypothetical protein